MTKFKFVQLTLFALLFLTCCVFFPSCKDKPNDVQTDEGQVNHRRIVVPHLRLDATEIEEFWKRRITGCDICNNKLKKFVFHFYIAKGTNGVDTLKLVGYAIKKGNRKKGLSVISYRQDSIIQFKSMDDLEIKRMDSLEGKPRDDRSIYFSNLDLKRGEFRELLQIINKDSSAKEPKLPSYFHFIPEIHNGYLTYRIEGPEKLTGEAFYLNPCPPHHADEEDNNE